jgi:hypothetical protein
MRRAGDLEFPERRAILRAARDEAARVAAALEHAVGDGRRALHGGIGGVVEVRQGPGDRGARADARALGKAGAFRVVAKHRPVGLARRLERNDGRRSRPRSLLARTRQAPEPLVAVPSGLGPVPGRLQELDGKEERRGEGTEGPRSA